MPACIAHLDTVQVVLTVFVIVTVMPFLQCSECWRLCSAGSSTMSTARVPGPHTVCYAVEPF